jgi:hypothetical protein
MLFYGRKRCRFTWTGALSALIVTAAITALIACEDESVERSGGSRITLPGPETLPSLEDASGIPGAVINPVEQHKAGALFAAALADSGFISRAGEELSGEIVNALDEQTDDSQTPDSFSVKLDQKFSAGTVKGTFKRSSVIKAADAEWFPLIISADDFMSSSTNDDLTLAITPPAQVSGGLYAIAGSIIMKADSTSKITFKENGSLGDSIKSSIYHSANADAGYALTIVDRENMTGGKFLFEITCKTFMSEDAYFSLDTMETPAPKLEASGKLTVYDGDDQFLFTIDYTPDELKDFLINISGRDAAGLI